MQSAAEVIQDFRERAGLSQEDVAARLGKTNGAVSQWETGRTSPARNTAIRLDALLNAEGAVLRSLGYVLPETASPKLDALEARVTQLEGLREEVAELRQLVATLQRVVRSRMRDDAAATGPTDDATSAAP